MPRSRHVAPASPHAQLTPPELVAAPELAVLVALQQLLELTTHMLAALHPELVGDRSCFQSLDPQVVVADQLIKLGARLTKAVTCYRAAAIAALHAPDT